MADGLGQAPGLGEGYSRAEGDGRHGISGVRWGEEWAGDTRRPARHDQRWSWQNRGGYVDELYEATSAEVSLPEAPEPLAVTRRQLVEAVDAWVKSRGASTLGQRYSVSEPRARVAYIDDLIAGPLGAVLANLGYKVTAAEEATTLGIIS